MLWNVYRFNYDFDHQSVIFPENDPIPDMLQTLINVYRKVIVQDSFELLRLTYDSQKVIIQKYDNPCYNYKGNSYFYTLRVSQ